MERRRSPRVNHYLPLKISSSDREVLTETKNISSNGAYCLISKEVELMTKLKVIMHVPVIPKQPKRKFHKIECMGVVVRKEPAKTQGRQKDDLVGVGIFFYDIQDRDKKYLENFVKHTLVQS